MVSIRRAFLVLIAGLVLFSCSDLLGPLMRKAGPPTFSPDSGTYSEDISLTLDTKVVDGAIHYTTDGSDPGPDSPLYSEPIWISGHGTEMTVKAVVVKNGNIVSSIGSEKYVITYPDGSDEGESDDGGSGDEGDDTDDGSDTGGDGGDIPGDGTGGDDDDQSNGGDDSDQTPGDDIDVLPPEFSPEGFSEEPLDPASWSDEDITVTLSTDTDGAEIFYTTDGSEPDAGSILYDGPVTVSGTDGVVYIRALAVLEGVESAGVGYYYAVLYPPAVPEGFRVTDITVSSVTLAWDPVDSIDYQISLAPAAGGPWMEAAYVPGGGETRVTIEDLSPDTAYYFRIRSTDTFKHSAWSGAASARTDEETSETAAVPVMLVYNLLYNTMEEYGLENGPSLTVLQYEWIELYSETPGAEIYYTLDGSDPVADGVLYRNRFQIPLPGQDPETEVTLRSVTISEGYENSPELNLNVTVFGAPQFVTGLQVTEYSESSFTITWNPDMYSEFTDIEWRTGGDAEVSELSAYPESSYTFQDAEPGVYFIRLKSWNEYAETPWTPWYEVLFPEE